MTMHIKNSPNNTLLTYLLYTGLSCFLTAILNVIHNVFILKIEFTAISFLIPTFAGLLFGLLLAKIKVLSDQLSNMAFTDSLTHIYNRLHFAHFLDAEIDKVERYGGTFSIIFFDLDHFKKVNDTYGHPKGDEVLEQITKIVSAANRNADIFARYGGEEFIILAPETDISGALIHAERLRHDIEKFEFETVGHITSSFRVTEFKSGSDTLEKLLDRVGIALYQAKDYGRNRVEKA